MLHPVYPLNKNHSYIAKPQTVSISRHIARIRNTSTESYLLPKATSTSLAHSNAIPTPLSDIDNNIRKAIYKAYDAPESNLPRRYPPISFVDSIYFSKVNDNKFMELNKILVKYAKDKGIGIDAMAKFEQQVKVSPDYRIFPNGRILKNNQHLGATLTEAYSKYLIKKLVPELQELVTYGTHGYTISYPDNSIRKIHDTQPKIISVAEYNFKVSLSGKSVMLQPSTRGCTAAVTAMLIYDAGGLIDPMRIKQRNIGRQSDMIADFKMAGFSHISCIYRSLNQLKHNIERYGPAIVDGFSNGLNSPVIIVDEVNAEYITIRDPYHGWMVDIFPQYLPPIGEGLHLKKP